MLLIEQSFVKSIKLKTQKFWYFTDAMPEKISENTEIIDVQVFLTWLSKIFTLTSQQKFVNIK